MSEKSRFLPLLLIALQVSAQNPLPVNYFQAPLDTVLQLAGNFAELRPNHFHAGIDIKTFNKTGMPVHAAADGYVSRIKISSFGYGKVIYITHPNGFVTVYGHLSGFNTVISDYINEQHYAQKKFEIELFPKPGQFQVKKNEIIAYSGNTGNSGGPHVHFEIRSEKSEKAINPLLFGIRVADNQKPQIRQIKIYPADQDALINGHNQSFVQKDSVSLCGNIYFGMEAFDTENGGGGKNGVYSVELLVNGKRIYYHQMDSIGFDQTRAINSFIDYPWYLKKHVLIQRSYVEENNKLEIYHNVVNRGVCFFDPDSSYHIRYILKDIAGNTSSKEFHTYSKPGIKKPASGAEKPKPVNLKCTADYTYKDENFKLFIPANCLYSDIDFDYRFFKSKNRQAYSLINRIGDPEIPLNDFISISVKVFGYSDSLKKHLFIARISPGGQKEYIGGDWSADFLTAKTNQFGDYQVLADTTAPTIQALTISEGKKITSQKTIDFKINDDFSGIGNFEGFIDGNWILLDYEYKQNKISYTIGSLKGKNHVLKLLVTDKAHNQRVFSCNFSSL